MSLAVRSPVVASAAVQPHRARSVAAPSPLARKLAAGAAALLLAAPVSFAASLPTEVVAEKVLCDAVCVSKLDGVALQTTPSGLTYKDIIVGDGPSPELGFQVVVDYVAMTDSYRVFDNSLAAGKPYDIRVVSDDSEPTTIAGLNEGLQTMRSGGVRRLFIPGNLSFPRGLASAAGRPRVPPNSPVVFDVALRYIPGLE